MALQWVFLAYGASALAALLLLVLFRARRWYWHVMSLLLAMLAGLTPPPAGWSGPAFDLGVGVVFAFLFFWGAGALFFPGRRRPPELVKPRDVDRAA